MIHWNLSGGIVHQTVLLPFIDALEDPNIAISVHDGFSGLSWSGGRGRAATILPYALDRTLEEYRQRNVGFNLLFSNHLVGAKDLKNVYGNQLLEKLHHKRNGVVVCDGILGSYVRRHYPKYRLVRSVIQAYLDKIICRDTGEIVSYFKEALELYDRVVVPSELNLRLDVLDQLDKSKLEFLVNNNCYWHCPYAEEHYTQIARSFRNGRGQKNHVCLTNVAVSGPERDRVVAHFRNHEAVLDDFGEPIQQVRFGQRITFRRSRMRQEEIGLMQRYGCTHFKLQGRDCATADFNVTIRDMVIDYGVSMEPPEGRAT